MMGVIGYLPSFMLHKVIGKLVQSWLELQTAGVTASLKREQDFLEESNLYPGEQTHIRCDLLHTILEPLKRIVLEKLMVN